jgi:glycosyltransferase involved in cell wall biosynthesis
MKLFLANFHRSWYGQPVAVFVLARELSRRGHDVTVAAPPGSALAERAREAGLAVFEGAHFPKSNRLLRTLRDVRALGRHFREQGYDVLHTNGSQDTWSVALARRLYRVPSPHLMTRHNTKRVRTNVANRWLYGRALDRLVLVSGGAMRCYAPLLELGALREEGISVIHPAFETDRFDEVPDRAALREELGVGPEVPLVGLVGRLDRDKGHAVLMEAAPAILARRPGTLFLFVGHGPEEEWVRGQVSGRGLDERVRFLGFRKDMPAVTAALDVSTLPALGTDSSPTVMKEAQALGVPVVVSDVGGAPEVVEDGVTGFVVPMGDAAALGEAILRLLDDRELARSMGARGRARAYERFSPARCAEEHEALYRSLGAPALSATTV